mmetsp:Transcript_21219/g.30368  ORF Transcript_21219/g.30368 Transcript_21219/m.30368 type:complete len:311 (-) Transcript_21219:102-1034(-)|eukprot:CAMPEP_0201688702 /NCGR_PEP_ID=MMETSP0578-20130828/2427_1 /ASSEMBLY_ACC=CAM_ASM_000663 /TAXON_ID=267565 /ORGANISM="Skeletonema grethea, Strain CCMP 1804" /LENGTH=310 /DNA_ID=CAMNT_0048173129 /DNA_START=141 /DNA_END=1073 /DNA_ORIENTATION=-
MNPSDLFAIALSGVKYAFFLYCGSAMILPIPSVWQEHKIWAPKVLPSLSFFAHIKVFLFNVAWMGCTLIGGLLLVPKFILGKMFGFEASYEAYMVENFTARLCQRLFVCPTVEIRGEENLPAEDGSSPAPVYIANHASQVDLAVVYSLGRRFRWIAKDSVRYLPGVGLTMTIGEHVFIKRTGKNKKSVSNLYEQSNKAIQSGLPMFFFPQGTRRMGVRLPFKDGAYRVAIENESKLIPISIHIPLSCWNNWYPLNLLWGGSVENVVLTIHKPIQAKKDSDKEELKKQTYDSIFSVLPLIGEEIVDQKKTK